MKHLEKMLSITLILLIVMGYAFSAASEKQEMTSRVSMLTVVGNASPEYRDRVFEELFNKYFSKIYSAFDWKHYFPGQIALVSATRGAPVEFPSTWEEAKQIMEENHITPEVFFDLLTVTLFGTVTGPFWSAEWNPRVVNNDVQIPYNQASSVYRDDVILFEVPKKGEVTINDWVTYGGEVDTPPLYKISKEEFLGLVRKFYSKYPYGQICRQVRCGDVEDEIRALRPRLVFEPGKIKEFSTEIRKLKKTSGAIPESYKAWNGYNVQVLPATTTWYLFTQYTYTSVYDPAVAAAHRKLMGQRESNERIGVQAFFIESPPKCKVWGGYSVATKYGTAYHHKEIEVYADKLSEDDDKIVYGLDISKVTDKFMDEFNETYSSQIGREVSREDLTSLKACCEGDVPVFIYVDKLFIDKGDYIKEVQADWLTGFTLRGPVMRYSTKSSAWRTTGICFTIEDDYRSPEQISFTYEILSQDEQGIKVRFEAVTSGQITDYFWDFGDGASGEGKTTEHTFKPGTYTVTLKAVDNEGRESTAIKTINFGDNMEFEIWADNTKAGNKTILHTRCSQETGTLDIYIDKVNDSLEKEFAIIEAQPVRCNESVEVGPFSLPGRYLIRAYAAGITEKNGFTVS